MAVHVQIFNCLEQLSNLQFRISRIAEKAQCEIAAKIKFSIKPVSLQIKSNSFAMVFRGGLIKSEEDILNHRLAQEEEERLEKLFANLDKDGNGKIDIHDLTVELKKLGVHHHYAEVCFIETFHPPLLL